MKRKLSVMLAVDDRVVSIYEVIKSKDEIETMSDMIHSVFMGEVIEVDFEPEVDTLQ